MSQDAFHGPGGTPGLAGRHGQAGSIGHAYLAPAPNGSDDTAALQAALNDCFGNRANPKPTAAYKQFQFMPGDYKISSPLLLEDLSGALLYGSGRFATRITNSKDGCVFRTTGCAFSKFAHMHLLGNNSDDSLLYGNGTGAIFDLDGDGSGIAVQSNTFENIRFQGGGIGLRIGHTGYMGSETLILNCFFSTCTQAGAVTCCFNAKQQTVVGGNISRCEIGLHSDKGEFQTITGVGFQENRQDILISNNTDSCHLISGCRTESFWFVESLMQNVTIISCAQVPTNPTGQLYFARSLSQPIKISGCTSRGGKIVPLYGAVVENSDFGCDDWCIFSALRDEARVYGMQVRTGRTWIGQGSGTPKLYQFGYWDSTGLFTPIS